MLQWESNEDYLWRSPFLRHYEGRPFYVPLERPYCRFLQTSVWALVITVRGTKYRRSHSFRFLSSTCRFVVKQKQSNNTCVYIHLKMKCFWFLRYVIKTFVRKLVQVRKDYQRIPKYNTSITKFVSPHLCQTLDKSISRKYRRSTFY